MCRLKLVDVFPTILAVVSAAFVLSGGVGHAAAETLTFDDPFGPAGSYTESGLTITSLAGSGVEGPGGFWDVPCCPDGADLYELTTGGLFDLVSIDILHSDPDDPITFTGFNGAATIASIVIDAADFGPLAFLGFTGLHRAGPGHDRGHGILHRSQL